MIAFKNQFTWQPVHIIVINIETLFRISATTATESGMKNLALRRRGLGLSYDHSTFVSASPF